MNTKKIIKRPTIKTYSHNRIHSTLYIKSSTPYISGLRRLEKWINKLRASSKKDKIILLMGMGKAVEKTLALAYWCQDTVGLDIEITIKSIDVIDSEVTTDKDGDGASDDDDDDTEEILKKRRTSGVEIKISV